MKTIIVFAHPNLESSVVNKAWLTSLPKDNENLTVHDLYKTYEGKEIDVEAEHQLLEQYDRIIFQFPLYWYSSPYLLKKWMDEVFTYGWCYGSNGDKLKGKELGVVVSTGGPQEAYRAGGFNHYTLSELLRPFQATANLVGATYLPVYAYQGALSWTEENFRENAVNYVEYILR